MTKPNHLTLQRLLALWELDATDSGQGGLGRLSGRDLRYFYVVFKDSFVARGPPAGPFRLTFVGTNLEAHIGRRMINVAIGDCFGRSSADLINTSLAEAVCRSRPLLAKLALSSANRPEGLDGELLCLPFVETLGSVGSSPLDDTTTIFGTLAVAGLEELPPDPTHRELSILAITIL